jgi:hypothetical protein
LPLSELHAPLLTSAGKPKKLQGESELAEQNKEGHLVYNRSIKHRVVFGMDQCLPKNAAVRRRDGPENAVNTLCGLCDLDYGEPHLVAQTQRVGAAKQWSIREEQETNGEHKHPKTNETLC